MVLNNSSAYFLFLTSTIKVCMCIALTYLGIMTEERNFSIMKGTSCVMGLSSTDWMWSLEEFHNFIIRCHK